LFVSVHKISAHPGIGLIIKIIIIIIGMIWRSEEELRNEIKIVKTFSDDIKMKFGLGKCARISLKNGTVYRKQHIGNTMENEIKELEPMKAYKYLGVEEELQ
jgi:hypothetical protein